MSNPYGWPVDPIEPLTYITDRLNNRKPFIYLRFNDGEAYSMFGTKKAPETNGEHVYSESIKIALCDAYEFACRETKRSDDVLVGSWWYEDPTHEAAKAFSELKHIIPKQWSRGSLWHREELEREGRCLTDELLRFVDAVREFRNNVYLVGPHNLRRVADALKASLIEVPEKDAFSSDRPVERGNQDLFIWCAGFPAKPWAWNCWIGSERTSYHIDAGSLFDGLCGRESREWLKRNGSAHSNFYYGEFARYLGIEV